MKALYLYKHHHHLRSTRPKRQQAFFDRSNKVLTLAHQLFPKGKNCSTHNTNLQAHPVEATAELVLAKFPVIYDAAFNSEGISARFNILVHEHNQWTAYEVKSSLRINKNHLQDIALKYYVAKKSGVELEDIFIIHINGDYTLKIGQVEAEKVFKITSIKTEVIDLHEGIEAAIHDAKEV